jgi:hypothetical protein
MLPYSYCQDFSETECDSVVVWMFVRLVELSKYEKILSIAGKQIGDSPSQTVCKLKLRLLAVKETFCLKWPFFKSLVCQYFSPAYAAQLPESILICSYPSLFRRIL